MTTTRRDLPHTFTRTYTGADCSQVLRDVASDIELLDRALGHVTVLAVRVTEGAWGAVDTDSPVRIDVTYEAFRVPPRADLAPTAALTFGRRVLGRAA